MNLISKEISRTELINRTNPSIPVIQSTKSTASSSCPHLPLWGVYWYVCSTRITTLYYVSFLYRFLTATFTNLNARQSSMDVYYLIFISIYVYLLNTSSPPPSYKSSLIYYVVIPILRRSLL